MRLAAIFGKVPNHNVDGLAQSRIINRSAINPRRILIWNKPLQRWWSGETPRPTGARLRLLVNEDDGANISAATHQMTTDTAGPAHKGAPPPHAPSHTPPPPP